MTDLSALEVDAVPTLLTVMEAAKLLGIGRTLAYDLVRTDRWPTPVLRVGKLVKIPSAPLIAMIAGGPAQR
jgi:excisionase family DNA binding protein